MLAQQFPVVDAKKNQSLKFSSWKIAVSGDSDPIETGGQSAPNVDALDHHWEHDSFAGHDGEKDGEKFYVLGYIFWCWFWYVLIFFSGVLSALHYMSLEVAPFFINYVSKLKGSKTFQHIILAAQNFRREPESHSLERGEVIELKPPCLGSHFRCLVWVGCCHTYLQSMITPM